MRLVKLTILIAMIFVLLSGAVSCAQAQADSLSTYAVIEARNIFRPRTSGEGSDGAQSIERVTIGTGAADLTHAASAAPMSIGDLVLTGIIKIRGRFKAILEKKSGDDGFYVGIDEFVDQYFVKDISANTLVLEKGGQEYTLNLKLKTKKTTSQIAAEPKEGIFEKNIPKVSHPAVEVPAAPPVQPEQIPIIEEKPKRKTKRRDFEPNIMKKLRMGGILQ